MGQADNLTRVRKEMHLVSFCSLCEIALHYGQADSYLHYEVVKTRQNNNPIHICDGECAFESRRRNQEVYRSV